MMKSLRSAALIAAMSACALLSAAAQAQAQDAKELKSRHWNFVRCDRYQPPTKKSDHLNSEPAAHAQAGTVGAAALPHCDRALADPTVNIPEHWRRRVHLLRARAVHELAAGNPQGALADLDRAVAEVREPQDPFNRRGLGLGLDLVRAVAYLETGRDEEALALLRSTQALRPYARASSVAAMDPRYWPATKTNAEVLRAAARLDPMYLHNFSESLLGAERWEEYVSIEPELPPPPRFFDSPAIRADMLFIAVELKRSEGDRLLRASRKAYALAALARFDEARAVLEDAQERMVKLLMSPPQGGIQASEMPAELRARGVDHKTYEALVWAAYIKKIATDILPILAEGQSAVELRTLIATDPVAARARSAEWNGRFHAVIADDLNRALARASGEAWAPPAAPTRPAGPDRGGISELQKLGANLLASLPEPEAADVLLSYTPSGDGASAGSTGVAVGRSALPPTRAIEIGSDSVPVSSKARSGATKAMTEELAILAAARWTLDQGSRGFVVVHRDDSLDPKTATRSTHLEIVPVDPDALPERFKTTPWRVIDAQHVVDTLGPVYPVPAPRPSRR